MACRYAHSGDFSLIADSYANTALCELLGIDRRTLGRWRLPGARIPWAAYQLASDRSRWGLAERDAAEDFNRTMIEGERDALRRQVEELREHLAAQAKLVDWQCANDPFVWPPDPRSQVTASNA